ncbi:MAG: sulfurtransferase TusA family protein [Desulfobacterales bacterium]|nr:sulfurtransferase TusA family protein [Desulfobacterales bacterium]
MSEITVDQVVDLRGLNCPMPMLKTKKALQGIDSGKVLKVEITDAGSKSDMPALLKRSGDELLETSENGDVYTFIIKKK